MAENPDDVTKLLARVRDRAEAGMLNQDLLDYVAREKSGSSAEVLYVNRKVLDLVTKAEMEREDYRRRSSPNVFFGTSKRYFGTEFRTIWINGIMMVGFLALIITALQISLRRQLTKV